MGREVYLTALGRKAELIEGPDAEGKFLVCYGSFQVRITASEFKEVSPSQSKKKRNSKRLTPTTLASNEILKVDLHGMTVADAMSALEASIDRAILNGAAGLEIVHGIGTGALKAATQKYLSASRHVSQFSLVDGNPGTTRAYLR